MKYYTRFRAYQLGVEGSSFSLSVDNQFTLIEAKLTDMNVQSLWDELYILGRSDIDVLHITSWDSDHCDDRSLRGILEALRPNKIEYPSYMPDSDTEKECLRIINNYSTAYKEKITCSIVRNSELEAGALVGRAIFFNPNQISDSHNDNSIVKFFRIGSFQILSLGDCESEDISSRLRNNVILQREVDVLILAHHGSENSICTKEFLEKNFSPSFHLFFKLR